MAWKWKRSLPLGLTLWWDEQSIRRKLESAGGLQQEQYLRDLEPIVETRRLLIQRKLIRKGQWRLIPPPRLDSKRFSNDHEDDNYYYSDTTGEILLKDDALNELRQRIRRDKKEQLDFWLPWFFLIIGAIGAATGFVAVWFK